MVTYQLVRGMQDILPADTGRWREVEAVVTDVLGRYGYSEIRLPLVESTALFSRGVGEATDLVEKEMFTFADRRGKSLSLRPEGTAGCARACIENGLLHHQTPRLWYRGAMFRYERPQKGRSREHTQIGAEVFGLPGPDIDAELLTMLARIYRELGIGDLVTLELNTIGSAECRARYRSELVEFLRPHADALDADSQRRLATNPLRILDSKVDSTRAIVADAPRLEGCLDDASREHFAGLRRALDAAGVAYRINPHLVRGLDYYTHTVFEWVTDALGAQNAVSSGGRYDGLVARLGGRPTPGLGFGMGLDRVVLLHAENVDRRYARADVAVVVTSDEHRAHASSIAEYIRDGTRLRVLLLPPRGLRSQFREADRSGARWAVIVGDDEVAENGVTMKWLRAERPQRMVPIDALVAELHAATPGMEN